jgi:MFS family permease
MSLTAMSTLLLLVGGLVADHMDTRRLLILCHAAAAVPAAALAAIVAAGALQYEWLIVYGLVMGTITAFILPAREAMMGDVVGPHGLARIQRAVTTTVGITFLAQIAGMLTARLAAFAGAAPVILVQTAIQLAGAFTSYKLAPSTRHHGAQNDTGLLARLIEGMHEVRNSYALLPVTILTLAIGVLFIGAFLVILPLILRAEFGGGVEQVSTMFVSFWGGSILSSLTIARLGTITHRGRYIAGALATGVTILVLMSIKAPLIVLYVLVFVWGMGAGVTISMSRTIVQEHAPPAHRARVLSIYQLGFTGGMSVGAFFIGYVVEVVGPRIATLVPAGGMALVLAVLLMTTKLWNITALDAKGRPA